MRNGGAPGLGSRTLYPSSLTYYALRISPVPDPFREVVSVVAGSAECSQDGVQAGGVGRDDAKGLRLGRRVALMGAGAGYQARKHSGGGEGEGAAAGGYNVGGVWGRLFQ